MSLKYKVGDKVRIKSFDWYNENKDNLSFYTDSMALCFANEIVTIKSYGRYPDTYRIDEDEGDFLWTNEMIEGLVEEETLIERVDDNGLPFNEWLSHKGAFHIPDGYELKDEHGNVINATKIVLEKKKKEYPKTFLGCCDVLNIENLIERGVKGYKAELFDNLQKLLICRDAYWKIAGEKMGLGKPWEPDYTNTDKRKFSIWVDFGKIKLGTFTTTQMVLSFPTEEMRDAFYENFKKDIEKCKELL